MKKNYLFLSIVLGSSFFLSACGSDNNTDSSPTPTPTPTPTPAPTPTPTPTIKTQASVYNVAANIALFGNIDKNNIDEAKLDDYGSTAILLNDSTNGYAAFGSSIEPATTALTARVNTSLDTITANYLKDIQALLVQQGAVVNVLVNKTSKNSQTDITNVTLDIDFKNTAQDAAYVRNLVLTYMNNNKAVKGLPISVNSTDKKLRLSLAFWILDGNAYVWGGSYVAAKYNIITQLYGDLINAAAITNAKPLKVMSAKESFKQSSTGSNAVDILWSIDSSGSMSEEQTNLANGANQFFTSLNKAGIDYRLAVNVQDAKNCKLRTLSDNTTQFIDKNTANAEVEWKKLSQPGTSGSSTETGFYCVREADLSKFDRPTAKNLVVFVSDEPENETYQKSIYASNYTARDFTDYKNYFLSTNATYFSIVGTATQLRPTFADSQPSYNDPSFSCNGAGGSASGGAHFKEISRLTGGSSASICSDASSWNVMFDEIVKTATGLASSFNLKQFALPSTIKVMVNGKTIARDTSSTNGFDIVYSANGASIVFFGNALPKSNESVSVEYDYITSTP